MDNRPDLGPQRAPTSQQVLTGTYPAAQNLRRQPRASNPLYARSLAAGLPFVDLTSDITGLPHAQNSVTSYLSASAGQSGFVGGNNLQAQYDGKSRISHSGAITSLNALGNADNGIDEHGLGTQERPSKRPRVDDNSLPWDEDSLPKVAQYGPRQLIPGSPLPMPHILATSDAPAPTRDPTTSSGRSNNDRTPRRANGLDPPVIATKLPPPRRVADYAPWIGCHPEDVLNEVVIKGGYFDKGAGQHSSETNSAKPTIWPNLSQKNNMGLQTLAFLFTSVMEKRQIMGRCTAPSTFKPPPRVTVTDTKREAWLRDLANPEVPLRKQSRTIPHGIKGKLLMEQCLTKKIPMPRAVWLAKCVGANELRAFRRKGVSGAAAAGGEAKWVREWTVHVEQFLDSVIAACGHADWKQKMDYAVRLVTSFYTERILDRDHFLDWVASAFARTDLDRLPIWIVLIQLYWRDLIAFARRGRKLAVSILEKLQLVGQNHSLVFASVKARLLRLIALLVVTHPACLILARKWNQCRPVMLVEAFAENSSTHVAVTDHLGKIVKRNDRLVEPLYKNAQNTRCASLRLYDLLDSLEHSKTIDNDKVTSDCMAILLDAPQLVHALLRWSASIYRSTTYRILLSAKVLVQVRQYAIDLDSIILDFLQHTVPVHLETGQIYRVIVELIRAHSFSLGRYFQWLMTSGSLGSSEGPQLATGLLQALPLDALPIHIINTRHMLAKRAGHADIAAQENLQARVIGVSLQHLLENWDAALEPVLAQLRNANDTVKSSLVRQLTAQAQLQAKSHALSLRTFCVVRRILEEYSDLKALGDCLASASDTEDTRLLASIADTIELHATVLAVTGHYLLLTGQLSERYLILRSQQSLDRVLVMSFIALYRPMLDKKPFVMLLENDLTICEQQSSIMVCSPASDSLVGMHALSLDSDADIDAVFASGNTMDERLMHRVFSRVVQNMGKSVAVAGEAPSKISLWLNQLRSVDSSNFDSLVREYVCSSFQSLKLSDGCRMISALVACGCTSFGAILELATKDSSPIAAAILVRLAVSSDIVAQCLHPTEQYRFCVLQSSFCTSNLEQLTSAFALAMEDSDFPTLWCSGMDRWLLRCSARDPRFLFDIANYESKKPVVLTNHHSLAVRVLHICFQNSGRQGENVDPLTITKEAEPLSANLCVFALSQLLRNYGDTAADLQMISALKDTMVDLISSGTVEIWPQLLQGLGPRVTQGIYRWIRERVLSFALHDSGDDHEHSPETLERDLEILDVTHHAAQEKDCSVVVVAITEKLKALETQLSLAEPVDLDPPTVSPRLYTLLHLSLLYGVGNEQPKSTDESSTSSPATGLLAALCSLLVHPQLSFQPQTLDYIHDIASLLADGLPEAALAPVARSLVVLPHIGAAAMPKLAPILGCFHSPDAWLALVSHSSMPPGTSQQQRLLMKQQQYHQQQQQQQQAATSGAQTKPSGRLPASLPLPPHQQQQQQPLSQNQHSHPKPPMSHLQQQATGPTKPPTTLGGMARIATTSFVDSGPYASAPSPISMASAGPASAVPGSFPAMGIPQQQKPLIVPYPIRHWEILPDAAPVLGENDTSLSLSLFGARRI